MASDDSTSKGEPNRTVTMLRPLNPSSRGKSFPERDLEKQALWLEGEMAGVRFKLREMIPVGRRIREHIKALEPGKSFRGCTSWTKYCDKRLHITDAAWRMMEMRLKTKGTPGREHDVRRRPAQPKPPKGLLDSSERQEAAVMALDAVSRFSIAKSKGDDSAAAEAWREYEQIADGGLRSVICGDRPNFQKLLRDVLDASAAIETAALHLHAALCNIVESGALDQGSALLASARASLTDAEKLLVEGKQLAAIRRRFNIADATVN